MATWTGCLCLILTLWMAGSGRPAICRTVASDPWWGTKEARAIQRLADGYRAAHDYVSVEAVEVWGYQISLRAHDDRAKCAYLTAIGAARLQQYRYRSALDALLEARDLAARLRDRTALGAVMVNLSSVYLQTWDLESALLVAEQGLLSSSSPTYYRLQFLIQLGRLHQALKDGRAAGFLLEAVEEARRQDDRAQEARAWDALGEERLKSGLIALAEHNANEAFRLRMMAAPLDLPLSYARLGAVKLALGDLDQAESFTNRAIAAAQGRTGAGYPYLLIHQRGEIRLARGDRAGALRDFSAAIDAAGLWRRGALPARSSLVAANVELQRQVFRSFIETEATEAMLSGSPNLAAESFEAAELNRAASLRDSIALGEVWRRKLSPEYWQVAAKLRAEKTPASAARFELTLNEMEAKAGFGEFSQLDENFRGRNSLTHFQHGLSKSEVFISLYLGKTESYSWVITRNSLSRHRLAAADSIREEIRKFRDAVRVGNSTGDRVGAEAQSVEERGARLYAALFGGLSQEEAAKPEWLLSLDDALFELPFSALLTRRPSGGVEYLVENHSVQVVPGALALMEDLTGARRAWRGNADGWFLGVGDPIYNSADPRWSAGWQPNWQTWFGVPPLQLNRLVGSGKEVTASAHSWLAQRGESGGGAAVLTGSDARRGEFVAALGRRPAVIHLAKHVLANSRMGASREQVAFGIGSSGEIETLSTAEVAMLDVPGAVVAMTGCASGSGEVQPGAGLLGLTRAWEMAGARAVVATGWPVNDTSGELFDTFYRDLRQVSPAEALRRSQVEMIHSGTWRSNPAYWAAYQVSSGSLNASKREQRGPVR